MPWGERIEPLHIETPHQACDRIPHAVACCPGRRCVAVAVCYRQQGFRPRYMSGWLALRTAESFEEAPFFRRDKAQRIFLTSRHVRSSSPVVRNIHLLSVLLLQSNGNPQTKRPITSVRMNSLKGMIMPIRN